MFGLTAVGDQIGLRQIDGGDLRGFDILAHRPYVDNQGRTWIDRRVKHEPRRNESGRLLYNVSGQVEFDTEYEPYLVSDLQKHGVSLPVVCNAATLRKDDWIELDQAILRAVRPRLRAWADLRAANTFGGFNAMASSVLEHEILNDPGKAMVDMDAVSEGQNYQPEITLQGVPLPIIHTDFVLTERFLQISRSRSEGMDTIKAEMAGRRVGETIERMTIGTANAYTYGRSEDYMIASKVYGYTNHPHRMIKTDLTAPDGSNTDVTLREVLAMRSQAYENNFFGPFMLYHSINWDEFMDDDYAKGDPTAGLAAPNVTLRDRLRRIEGIQDVRRLDYLDTTDFTLLLVQMTADVAQAVVGTEITTVMWDTKGGMQHNFKVMAIQVPRIRSVHVTGTAENSSAVVTGIVHADDSA